MPQFLQNLLLNTPPFQECETAVGLSFEQRTFARATVAFIDIAKRAAGTARDELIAGFVVFFMGFQSRVVPHPVTNPVVVIQGVVVLCSYIYLYAFFRGHCVR